MNDPLKEQVGGNHYKGLPIQPVEYCQKNKLGFCESCVVKYVSRHREKNGREDIKKAIHFLNLLLELEYPEKDVELHPCPRCQALLPPTLPNGMCPYCHEILIPEAAPYCCECMENRTTSEDGICMLCRTAQ